MLSKRLLLAPLLFLTSPALASVTQSLAVDTITDGSEIATLNRNTDYLDFNKLDYRPGNIIPHKDASYDLGSSAYRWKNIYVSGSTDTATSGFLGEYISTASISGTTSLTPTDTYLDFLRMTLTAGDWDLTATLLLDDNGANGTAFIIAISSTAGNSSAGLNRGQEYVRNPIPPLNETATGVIPRLRVRPTTTTVYYLKAYATFTGGPPQILDGFMTARRVR